MRIITEFTDRVTEWVFRSPEEILKYLLSALTRVNDLIEKYDENQLKRLDTYGRKIEEQVTRFEEITERWNVQEAPEGLTED